MGINELNRTESHGRLPSPERSLSHYQFVITAGLGGIGEAMANEVLQLGGVVHATTHSQSRLDTESPDPNLHKYFLNVAELATGADIGDLTKLKDQLRADGRPVVLIHSAAGGMETFSRKLLLKFLRLTKETGQAQKDKLRELKAAIPEWLDGAIKNAALVNAKGPATLTRELVAVMPPGSWIINYASMWSHVVAEKELTRWGKVAVPISSIYQGVAKTKADFEIYLNRRAEKLAKRGIHIGNVVGHLIEGTDTADFFRTVYDQLPAELFLGGQKNPLSDNLAKPADMVAATTTMILHPDFVPQNPWGVYELFVMEHGRIGRAITPEQRNALRTQTLPF